jgi:pimeloyl-ACP methyl ester carboxylesterase
MMIHGAFCGGWAFEKFARAFADEGFPTIVPTLRHHDGGAPDQVLGRTSLTDYAADLAAAIAALGQPPILVGHSMGGLLAQMLAARCAVRAIVLLSPSAPWGVPPATMFEFASAGAMLLTGDFWTKPIWPSYEIAAANTLDRLPDDERQAVFARFVPESGLATFEIMHWAFDVRRASAVDAEAVRCPVLCLSGSEDRVNPPATVRAIARRYRDRADYEDLPGHSHWMIGEPGWDAAAARVLSWIDTVLETPMAFAAD